MNTKRFLAFSTLLAATLALPLNTAKASEFFNAQTQSGTTVSHLTLRIDGLDSTEGQLLVGLYDTRDGFKTGSEMDGKSVPVQDRSVQVVFENIPVGQYAVKVFHDKNGDGELDTNALGIPSEPYGFSRDASDPFSAPEWDEARFTLPKGHMTQTIDLS